SFSSIEKQLVIVNFFYSKCNKTCVHMYDNIDWLFNKYKDNDIIRFVSITVDPENDTSNLLSIFAKKHNATPGKWDFLTADTSIVYPLAKEQFFVNALKNKEG